MNIILTSSKFLDILEIHHNDILFPLQAKDFHPKIKTPELLEAGYTAKELHLARQKTPELHMSVGGVIPKIFWTGNRFVLGKMLPFFYSISQPRKDAGYTAEEIRIHFSIW